MMIVMKDLRKNWIVLLLIAMIMSGCTGQTEGRTLTETSVTMNTSATFEMSQMITEETDADNAVSGTDEQDGIRSTEGDSSAQNEEGLPTEDARSEEKSSITDGSPDNDEAVISVDIEQEDLPVFVYDRSSKNGAVLLSGEEDLVGGTYIAIGNDESVVDVSGVADASVTGALLQKISGNASSADGASFYGLNSAVRVYDDATLTIKDCEIVAETDNATGIFAYGGGTIYVSDSIVNVTGGGAGGIQVAGGGTLYATDLTVTSASKAAIRSDRGGGLMIVDGGSYTSTGSNGCPAIYSTADITVSNAECVSTRSRAVIIEGKNSVTLNNCTITGNDQSSKEGSVRANVLLYQSASGDAKEGTSIFRMNEGRMVCQSGAMFYCTNTYCQIYLTDTELVLSDDGTLLIVSSGRWGKTGNNGGHCSFVAEKQILEGDIIVDEISSLEISLNESTYNGAITGSGDVTVILDDCSSWTLTGDSYVSEFIGNLSNVLFNGYTLYVNGAALSSGQ